MIFIISYKKNLLILRNESLVVLSNGSNGQILDRVYEPYMRHDSSNHLLI